jgi:CHAD domain-containing protein
MAKARKIKGIDCTGTAGAGIKLVLERRFREMSKLRDTALNWNDPEGVHSMRVASRRLRSALRDFTPYLRKRGLASSLRQIKRIADALGEVRDQDVAIDALEKLRSTAPEKVSAVIGELISIREVARNKARQDLNRIVARAQLKQLNHSFVTAVDAATAPKAQRGTASNPDPTYLDMARSVILDRLKELEKLSNSLYRPLKPSPLHDMRIAAKRLRYAIELFQVCWGADIVPFAAETARLQTSLGDLHDCDIWIESFGEHILESKKKKEQYQNDEFSWLLSHFIHCRNGHFDDSFDIWREWEGRGMSDMLRQVVMPSKTEPSTEPPSQPSTINPS